MHYPLIMSQTSMPGTFTITNGTPTEAQDPLHNILTISTHGTFNISLSSLQQYSNLLINMPANSLGTLVVTDESGHALLTITEKPFRASAQQLLNMVEREDRKLGASI